MEQGMDKAEQAEQTAHIGPPETGTVEQGMVERVARAIASAHGDDFDAMPADKQDWVAERGQFGGRYRDVNEPFRCDYEDMAEAAIRAMREPTEQMKDAGQEYGYGVMYEPKNEEAATIYRAMINAALNEKSPAAC